MVKLDLRGTAVDDEGMAYLKDLDYLIELDLSESIVGNDGLGHLKDVKQLEKLNLWAARVGDDGMQYVGQLTNLTRLNLDNVGFPSKNILLTDDGVKHLATLKKLEWLHLGKTKITDASLEIVAGLPKLNELVITFCQNVTDEGIEKLRQARPNLKIIH